MDSLVMKTVAFQTNVPPEQALTEDILEEESVGEKVPPPPPPEAPPLLRVPSAGIPS